MTRKMKAQGARRDPTVILSFALMLISGIQANLPILQNVFTKHPWAYPMGMFLVSLAVLVLRWFDDRTLAQRAPDPLQNPQDDGTAG